MIWDFWSDPVGWYIDSLTWMFNDPPWLIAANLLFWPLLFLRAWGMDKWDEWRRKKVIEAR